MASRERKAQRNRNFNLIQVSIADRKLGSQACCCDAGDRIAWFEAQCLAQKAPGTTKQRALAHLEQAPADLRGGQEVVLLWEQLRRHDLPAAKRAALVAAVMAKVQGRVAELAGSHASSRVIQACVKHGTAEGESPATRHRRPAPSTALAGSAHHRQGPRPFRDAAPCTAAHLAVLLALTCAADRKKILAEVSPKLVELSKSPYGHFVVSKLVTTAGKEDLAGECTMETAFCIGIAQLCLGTACRHAHPQRRGQ